MNPFTTNDNIQHLIWIRTYSNGYERDRHVHSPISKTILPNVTQMPSFNDLLAMRIYSTVIPTLILIVKRPNHT